MTPALLRRRLKEIDLSHEVLGAEDVDGLLAEYQRLMNGLMAIADRLDSGEPIDPESLAREISNEIE